MLRHQPLSVSLFLSLFVCAPLPLVKSKIEARHARIPAATFKVVVPNKPAFRPLLVAEPQDAASARLYAEFLSNVFRILGQPAPGSERYATSSTSFTPTAA